MVTTEDQVREIQSLLASLTPEHAAKFVQALQIVGNPAPAVNNSMVAQKVSKASAKSRNKKQKHDGDSGGPKRPLNSWMAFRKFYNASLAPYTQKTISKVLMAWWRDDPFEAKWALLAKAYSILRGTREKEDAPLDEYFSLAAPVIGVIPPNLYQAMMGWQIIGSGNGDQTPQIIRTHWPDLNAFDKMYTTTVFSVDDVVAYCKDNGYHKGIHAGNNTNPSISSNIDVFTMTVQPSILTSETPTAIGQPAIAAPAVAAPAGATQAVDVVNSPNTPLEIAIPTISAGQDTFQHVGNTLAQELAVPNGQATLNSAVLQLNDVGSYPYDLAFDPAATVNIDAYHPAENNVNVADDGKWDAYDPATNQAYDNALDFSFGEFLDDGMF